jgi:hypothetical protein
VDIRMYFQKIREAERSIQDPYVVAVSLETAEGGKPGRMTEVSREAAARLIVEGKVRLATADERTTFLREAREALAAAEEAMMAGKIQLTVVSDQAHRIVKPRSEKG